MCWLKWLHSGAAAAAAAHKQQQGAVTTTILQTERRRCRDYFSWINDALFAVQVPSEGEVISAAGMSNTTHTHTHTKVGAQVCRMHPYAVPAIYIHYINTQAGAPIRQSSRKVHEPSTHSYSWKEVKLDLKHFHSNFVIHWESFDFRHDTRYPHGLHSYLHWSLS